MTPSPYRLIPPSDIPTDVHADVAQLGSVCSICHTVLDDIDRTWSLLHARCGHLYVPEDIDADLRLYADLDIGRTVSLELNDDVWFVCSPCATEHDHDPKRIAGRIEAGLVAYVCRLDAVNDDDVPMADAYRRLAAEVGAGTLEDLTRQDEEATS